MMLERDAADAAIAMQRLVLAACRCAAKATVHPKRDPAHVTTNNISRKTASGEQPTYA